MIQIFPKLEAKLQVLEKLRKPKTINVKITIPRHILFKLQKIKDKEYREKEDSRRKKQKTQHCTYIGINRRMTSDVSETIQTGEEQSEMAMLRENH